MEISTTEKVNTKCKSLTSDEAFPLDGLGTQSTKKTHDQSPDEHVNAVAGPVRNIEISQAECYPTYNDMLYNMSYESY